MLGYLSSVKMYKSQNNSEEKCSPSIEKGNDIK